MTTPVPSGYPDFGRYQAQATKVYLALAQNGIVANTMFNLGYVGDVAVLNVASFATAGTCDLTFFFTTQDNAGFTTGIHQITHRLGTLFEQTVPVLGPYCHVTLDVGTTPIDITTTIVQATTPFKHFDVLGFNNVLASAEPFNAPVGNTFVSCTRIIPGPAVLFAALPPVVSSVSVYATDKLGNNTFISRVFGNGVEGYREMFLPPMPIRLQLSNAGPGAQNFVYSLTAGIGAS